MDLPVNVGVYTREILVVAHARLEYAWSGVGRCVELTPDAVIDMLAEIGGVGTSGVTRFEAEVIAAHEAIVRGKS